MKVINRNEAKEADYPKRIVCDHCGAELEYNEEDEHNGLWGMKCVTCPVCGEEIFVSEHRAIQPTWGVTFNHTDEISAVKLKDEEIQEMVDKCYERLMSPEWKAGEFYITMMGDTLVFGVKFEDEVNVYVTRDYWEDSTCL